MFPGGVLRVISIQSVGITKDCGRFFKRHPVLLKIGDRLMDVPCKHICVYTPIRCSKTNREDCRKCWVIESGTREKGGTDGTLDWSIWLVWSISFVWWPDQKTKETRWTG